MQGDLLIRKEQQQVVCALKSDTQELNVPEGILSIGERAFANCNDDEIRLPFGLVEIGDQAGYGCRKLSRIEIPETVKVIGEDAFYGCGDPFPGQHALLEQGIGMEDYPFRIAGKTGSAAHSYAQEAAFPFEAME